uniref:Cyclic AMP-dependent transcription factor ATF-7 n=1 Tax=Callorhinchus milii TaxID=7868 RepID=A0A4W3HHZ6_CALMI
MGDDRPFVCNAPGCGQRFTNEDHLAVHKHKHEMTLKFGPARDGVIVADQTPTPTRFLKNCEEVGLFNELANPFEQEFKKADEDDSKKSPLDMSLPSSPEVKIKEEDCVSQETSACGYPLPLGIPPKHTGNTTPTIVRPGTLLLAYDNSPSLQPTLPSPTSVITPTPPSNRTLASPTGPVPVLLHLPNGQTMPVNIPSNLSSPTVQMPTVISIARPASMVPNIPGIPGPPVNSSGPPSPSPQLVQSEAKLRLKAVLSHQGQSVLNGGMIVGPLSMVTSQHEPSQVCTLSPAAPSPSQPQDSPSQPTPSLAGRRRRLTEEDPDERRRRFLERNRAAASRCRQKRKVWVLSLEKKAEELTHMNVQLQNEVTILRNEVAQLKQLLLAHKDCPVTTLQKKTHEYITDESPKESSEATGSPAPVIQHSSHGVATNGLSSRAAAEAVATSVLTQMANQRTELNLPLHPHVIMSTQSQSAGR